MYYYNIIILYLEKTQMKQPCDRMMNHSIPVLKVEDSHATLTSRISLILGSITIPSRNTEIIFLHYLALQ